MPLRHGFKAEANRIAARVRHNLGLVARDPVDPWVICAEYDIEVIAISELRESDGSKAGRHFLEIETQAFSALTFAQGLRRVIVHNDGHSPERQRSNLTHELAHCFLGHPVTLLITAKGDRNRHSDMEAEASFLGGVLLIPNEAAFHIMTSGLGAAAERIYGVSSEMLTYRLRVSGALKVAARRAGSSKTSGVLKSA
jgi:Zn-dependent peptidase ImmA (M78 family)